MTDVTKQASHNIIFFVSVSCFAIGHLIKLHIFLGVSGRGKRSTLVKHRAFGPTKPQSLVLGNQGARLSQLTLEHLMDEHALTSCSRGKKEKINTHLELNYDRRQS